MNDVDHAEISSEICQELNNAHNVHTSAAMNTPQSQGVLELQKQPDWAMKASSVVKNATTKFSALEWRAEREHIKLLLFILVAVVIVSMQVIESSPPLVPSLVFYLVFHS